MKNQISLIFRAKKEIYILKFEVNFYFMKTEWKLLQERLILEIWWSETWFTKLQWGNKVQVW